ncbi:MAG: hypothetical protein MHPSP_002884, partial [Paramarteilia canceri]
NQCFNGGVVLSLDNKNEEIQVPEYQLEIYYIYVHSVLQVIFFMGQFQIITFYRRREEEKKFIKEY